MLSAGNLSNDLQAIFESRIENPDEIAGKISQAYANYARQAQGPNAEPVVLVGVEHFKMRGPITALIRTHMAASAAASTIAQAITSFWLIPPIVTSVGGTCVSIVPAAGINKMMSTNASSTGEAAQSLAMALDSMTRTVMVSCIPPLVSGFLW
jgi:hypothetical protein